MRFWGSPLHTYLVLKKDKFTIRRIPIRPFPLRRRIAECLLCGLGRLWARELNDWSTESTGIRIVEQYLVLEHFPKGLGKLRVAFLSDFHAGPSTGSLILEKTQKIVLDWQPDLILLGGDYVCFSSRYAYELVDMFSAFNPPYGIFGVWGNHDWAAGRKHIEKILSGVGIQFLRNHAVCLPDPFDKIWIVGIDDVFHGFPNPKAAFELVAPKSCVIFLSHSPDGLMTLSSRKVDLALVGHTHGGQVCLPGGRPIIVTCALGRRYPWGLHQTQWGWLYVSRGLSGGFPVRVYAPPEVTFFTLTGVS